MLETASNRTCGRFSRSRKNEIFKTMTEKLKDGWSSYPFVYLFAPNRHQAERLQEILRNYDIALPIVSGMAVDGKEEGMGHSGRSPQEGLQDGHR